MIAYGSSEDGKYKVPRGNCRSGFMVSELVIIIVYVVNWQFESGMLCMLLLRIKLLII